jgi:penicillin-binding protein 1A
MPLILTRARNVRSGRVGVERGERGYPSVAMTRPPSRPQRPPTRGITPRRRRRARTRKSRSLLIGLLAAAALLVGLGVAAGAGVYAFGASCDLDSLREVSIGENSFVYAADGSLLGAIPAERNRQPVSLKRVSKWVPKATVAIEDRRFYLHGGLDAEGIARAVWANVKAGEVVQGGSTITQQLVRNLYISRERTAERKLKEACLAVKLERARTKSWILRTYLNQVFYGNLAYGIEAAAQTYFSRSARSLDLRQAALLAGLTQAPSAYDPFVDPATAIARRDQVLTAMLEEGMIGKRQYDWAVGSRDLRLRPGKLYREIREPYFFSYVRDELTREYGTQRVREGGLRIYSTIVPLYQVYAQQAVRETLNERTDPAGAVIAIEPRTGAIRAMTAVVPGRALGEFNLVSQARRQPGSTFKTFVLAAAVERGINPDSTYYVSAPFTYRPNDEGNCEDGTWWCVKTYDSSYVGWTSIHRATLRSDNSVFAQLTLDVGPERVASMARRLGVRTPLEVNGRVVPSVGLGALALSPLDLASAYATLAANGIHTEPTAIRRVVLPNGKVDTEAGWGVPKRARAISDAVAYEVTKILEENVDYGTGTRANLSDRDVAGKTGTTDKNVDAWFAGYTPNLSTTVWVGYPRGSIPMDNVHGISVAGGTFPAEIWRRFMERALENRPAPTFPEPLGRVEWKPFERGEWALSYDPGYGRPSTDEDKEEKTEAEKTKPAKPRPVSPPRERGP